MGFEVPTTDLARSEGGGGAAPADEDSAREARRLGRRRAFHKMVVVVALAMLVRIPLLSLPMGQSAGRAAYMGQRWFEGAIPYRDSWDSRAPALYLVSGAIVRKVAPLGAALEQGLLNLFLGQHAEPTRITAGEAIPETARAVMLAISLATLLVVYGLVRQWCNRTEAVVAAGLCGFFSGAILVQGDCLEPGPPMTLLVALAVLAALRGQRGRWPWLAASGLAGGLAMCFEPLALLYVVALALWVAAASGGSAARRWVLRPSLLLLAAMVPVACFVAYFWRHGALWDLWRSAVVYNAFYRWLPIAHRTPLTHWSVVRALAPEQGALWLFAGGWAVHAFSQGFRRETGLVALWCAVAVAAAMATRQVETADFLQTVPPLAIGAALAATNPSERFLARDERGRIELRSGILLLLAIGLAYGFYHTERRAYLAQASREEISTDRAAVRVADLIRDHTMPGHSIYVWGRDPQIYVLADRPAAYRIFYNRPLNVPWLVDEYFGHGIYEDLYWTLVREPPAFVVVTERYLPERLEELGPLAPWFYFMRENYVQWKIVDAQDTSFIIFARKDRAGIP